MNTRRTVIICGIISALGWAFVSWLTYGLPPVAIGFLNAITFYQFPETIAECANGFGYEIENRATPTAIYLVAHFLLFGLAIIPTIAILRARKGENHRSALILILAFGAIFRATLLPSIPIHENDFYRYLWDGKSLNKGVNPYLFSPAEVSVKADPLGALFSDPLGGNPSFESLGPDQVRALETLVELRRDNAIVHRRIGHPNIPTIYPPVAQASFWISDRISGGSVIGWKAFVILIDLGIGILIALLLKSVGKNPSNVIIYAWCPLVLKEFANSGHHDAIPIFLTLLAILLTVRCRHVASTLSLALATLGKFFPITLLPILSPPSSRTSWPRYFLFATVIVAAYLPFLIWQDVGFAGVFSGLHTYNEGWEFFSGIFAVIHWGVVAISPEASLWPAKIITAFLFTAIVVWVTFAPPRFASGIQLVRKCFIVVGAVFILNPSAFPWYFAWVVPFLCFFPQPAWIALGGLLPLTYLSFHPSDDIPLASAHWLGFPTLSWIIWGGFLAILVIGRWPIHHLRHSRNSRRESA